MFAILPCTTIQSYWEIPLHSVFRLVLSATLGRGELSRVCGALNFRSVDPNAKLQGAIDLVVLAFAITPFGMEASADPGDA